MSDEHVENIFDKHAFDGQDGETVPVVIETGEGKRQVGEAKLEVTGDGVFATMFLKNDDPEEVREFLKGGLTRISVSDAAPELKDAEIEALHEFEPHEHKPVQHRDGREPWCDFCGLSMRFDKPIDRLEHGRPAPKGKGILGKPDAKNFGFPQPSRLHNQEGEN